MDLDTNNRRMLYLGGRLSPTAENAAREDTRPPIGNAPIICFHHNREKMAMMSMGLRSLVCAVACFVLAGAWAAAPLDYSYTVDRRDVEKKPGSLHDGNLTEGISWHTKFTSTTSITCELRETCDLDCIEIYVPKWTKWYIVKELRVSLDDGHGDFGDPVVLPGLPRRTNFEGSRDASCTNHLFAVEKPGKAVRVRVEVVSDAAAAIGEIRLIGAPFRSATPKPEAESARSAAMRPGTYKEMDNDAWRIAFNPLGGRIQSLYSKVCGFELTNPAGAGSFVEEVWDRRGSHDFLIKKPFEMTYETGANGRIEAHAAGNFAGGAIDFLKVEKFYSTANDSTALKIRYRFTNIPEAMALQNYAPLIHATLGVFGRDVTCYYPTTEGIVAVAPGKRGNEFWGHHPARGWMAAATDDGLGVAVTMPFGDLKAFYSWFTQVPTLEWRMTSVGLECGASYDVETEVIPFTGLTVVSGAGGGVVGALSGGLCRIVSSRAGELTAEDGKKSIPLSFTKPGASASFRTTAKTVILKRDGREICRLEAAPDSGSWTLAKAGPQRESSVAEVDLSCYTNFPHQANAPRWGKPLPGRRLKVAALTGPGNLIEIGRLADRFDFEFRAIGVPLATGNAVVRKLGNPIFADGDNFSLVNTSDLERGIATVLAYDADVILVGGLPWEALTKDHKAQILAKVKAGKGLVWIGQDRNVPELGFRLAKTSAEAGVPTGAERGAFASVPFSLLGTEPVYAIAVGDGTKVHATCSGNAYLAETPLGNGRVFNIAYRALTGQPWPAAGLTPAGLRDFYETRAAPAEHYYSLLAKALLSAGGKRLPVRLGAADVTPDRASVAVSADDAVRATAKWRVTDSFGSVIAQGERPVDIAKGGTQLALDGLALPVRQGPLAFELVLATERAVLDWGAWAFAHEPAATIAALKPDDTWREEGETLAYTAKVRGVTKGYRLHVALVDSFGRTLRVNETAAASEVKGTFVISNALPARCYTLNARLRAADGSVVARRRAEVRVRPDASKDAWDGFEVGTWANAHTRAYLWPDLAAVYRDIGLSTLIANPYSAQIDFPMRHNFHPTLLSDAGLHRSSEPDAYSKTGDKLKLVRPTCLSSPDFFARRAKWVDHTSKELRRAGLRFIWFGDEQSITGYGGSAIDFCFSEHCLREMRKFVQAKYGTLDRLNAEWETDFARWDDVVPFTRQEIWAANGRHVAGWADHLEFMDDRLTNSLAFSILPLRKIDPSVRYALSGTQAPSAYGGTDWWKQLNVLDAALSYDTGGQLDIHRSFCPNGGFMPWKWGYGGKGPAAVDGVWRSCFAGCRGLIGFQSSSQINDDWTYSQGLRDTHCHVRRLADGTGLHFVQNLRTRPDVAILYSQASLRAAFIENRREEHDLLEEKVRRILMNLGYAYDYVSYDQLAAGVVAARGYKALVLADAVAMSEAEVAGVRAFAEKGGLVIAEGMPALRKQNLVLRQASPLADLFNAERHVLLEKIDVRYLKAIEYPDQSANAAVVRTVQDRYEAALVLAGAATAKLGMADAETGKPIVNADVSVKADAAGHLTWCVLASRLGKVRDVEFTFPKAGWVCDLVSGRAYGVVKELRLPLGKGVPYAFAQFDAPVDLSPLNVEGATLKVALTQPVDGAVHVRVFRPDGTEAWCYARNVLVKDGRAAYTIPFALSDPRGDWRVEATAVFGGSAQTAVVRVADDAATNAPPPLVRSLFASPTTDAAVVARYAIETSTDIDWTRVAVTNEATGANVPFSRTGNVLALRPSGPWPTGVTRLAVAVADVRGQSVVAHKVFLVGEAPKPPLIRLRDDGVALLDGQPWFPIGIYAVEPYAFNGFDYARAFADLGRAGVTLGHSYGHWRDAAFYDGAEAAGAKLFVNGKPAVKGDAWFMSTRARAPVVAWYIGDDTSMNTTPQELLDRDEACRMLDGTRLTCHADGVGARFAKSKLQDYVDFADVFLPEIYPFDGHTDERSVAEVCRDMDRCFADYARFGRTPRARAVWPILQCFDGGSWKRYPTASELYATSFAALVHGAQGILWFKYGGAKDEKHRYSGMFRTPEDWATMTNITHRISALRPILLSRTPPQPPVPEIVRGTKTDPLGQPAVTLLLKRHGGAAYVLAVNAAPEPVRARFRLDVRATTAKVAWERRDVTLKDGVFEDDFDALGVHVYRMKENLNRKKK